MTTQPLVHESLRFQHSLPVVLCSCSCFFSAPAACADNEVLLKIRYAMTVSHKLYIFAKHVSCFSSPAFSLLVEARHPFVNFNYDKSILCSCVVVLLTVIAGVNKVRQHMAAILLIT